MPTWEICRGVVFGAGLQPQVGDGARLRADGHAYHVLHLVDAVALGAAPGQLGEPLALPDQDEPLRKILVNLELAHEAPDDAQALWVVLAGEVPRRPHLEPARGARHPHVVLALLQRLQDEVGVRADDLHRGGHRGLPQ